MPLIEIYFVGFLITAIMNLVIVSKMDRRATEFFVWGLVVSVLWPLLIVFLQGTVAYKSMIDVAGAIERQERG